MKTNMMHTLNAGNASVAPTSGKRLGRTGRNDRTSWRVRLAAVWLVWTALLVFAGLGHAAETVTYYYTDQQGTVLATADAAGNVLSNTDYRPYGTISRGTPVEGPGYAGHVEDTDSGLVYMQARYYDPSVGRFLSVDPVTTKAGTPTEFGRFTYTANDPIGKVDPDGKQDEDGDEIEAETRAALARLNPPIGPNMAAAGFSTPPPPLPLPETFSDHIVAQELGLEPKPTIGEAQPAAERANDLAQTLSARTSTGTTIAVTDTVEGVRVISSSEGYLRKTTQRALEPGEVYGKGVPGVHAEVNGINAARGMGLTPTGTAASRPICASCAGTLQDEGVEALSPLKQR
ncbi:RHS repeat-associated core domain-containing protein [Xanthomonas sp. NCPPB 2632]|uniref:RHS repeat-associated core domain-containing protein n=1 Tax=Xanthomonas sp. NCPPB 2632 TaxID=3240912 RepID=UPI0035113C17